MPSRIRALPRTRDGQPIVWFADDQAGKRIAAIRDGICWICGQKLPTGNQTRKQNRPIPFTFLGVVRCAIDRIATDPPAHRECATYTASVGCSFSKQQGLGKVLWSTTGFTIERPPFGSPGGVLLKMHDPTDVVWWVGGGPAGRDEAVEHLLAAYDRMVRECEYDPDPAGALVMLERQFVAAARWLPD